MNPHTAKVLGKAGVDEYWQLQQHLMTQLETHRILHGEDFSTRCRIAEDGDRYCICCEDVPIDGISSTRHEVIDALFTGAAANLGR